MMKMKKDITKANGKIKICNFKKLDPNSFQPYHVLTKETIIDELVLCSPAGEIYINKKFESTEYLAEVFEMLMPETKETLQKYAAQMKQEFPHVQSFKDWGTMEGTDKEKTRAFAMLMVPIELKRRAAEQQYYN